MKRQIFSVVIGCVCLSAFVLGCGSTPPPAKTAAPVQPYGTYDASLAFRDDATTNTKVTGANFLPQFLDREGKTVKLKDYHGMKNVALFFMRGMTRSPGGLCPTCSAQTSRLVANLAEFAKRDTEVLIIFPGEKQHAAEFAAKIQKDGDGKAMPIPVLLDEDFKAVDRLGIRGDSAKPSTFLFDKAGQVRFAYVGATTADRPSLAAIYKQLDDMAKP